MSEPDDSSERALKRLDEGLDAWSASRRRDASASSYGREVGEGYRLVAQMVGGPLGGLGLGWLLDRYVPAVSPWGVIGGVVIGVGLALYSAIQTASRISARAEAARKAPPPAVDEEED